MFYYNFSIFKIRFYYVLYNQMNHARQNLLKKAFLLSEISILLF